MQVSPHVIGQRIRRAREDARWRRQRLAQAVGVSRYVIYRLEEGRMQPREDLIESIATALERPLEEFLAPGPRLRTRVVQQSAEQVEMPVVVAQLLMTGRLGKVTAKELQALIANAHDPMFADDVNLLELECKWRRACGAIHKPELKQAVDEVFERIRKDLQARS